jgi:hypothetical protein
VTISFGSMYKFTGHCASHGDDDYIRLGEGNWLWLNTDLDWESILDNDKLDELDAAYEEKRIK